MVDTNKSSKKKTANYQENKDVWLCFLWISISEDPLVNTNKEDNTFWGRAATHYKEDLPGATTRSFGSLKARWGVLQKAINKLRACVNKVKQHNQSGALVKDCLNQALRLCSEDQGTIFKHLQCYNILMKAPKWSQYSARTGVKGATLFIPQVQPPQLKL